MKKCFYFPSWKKCKDVMINLDESYIISERLPSFNGSEDLIYNQQSAPSDLILSKLCQLTGIKMYSDYVIFKEYDYYHFSAGNYIKKYFKENIFILDEDGQNTLNKEAIINKVEQMNNILQKYSFNNKHDFYSITYEDVNKHATYPSINDFNDKIDRCVENNWYKGRISKEHLFEQYSKFLRNEESEWEEIKEVLDI